jgi:predicted O-methyltransferase YrrM
MIINPDIEKYIAGFGELPNSILAEMEAEAQQRNFPYIGPLVGRFLVSLVKFGHVHTVLDCGSGFGYSAMWMAFALAENARITCIEHDAVNIQRAKTYFEKAGLSHKVTFHQGDAREIVPTLTDTFDMILNDVDKIHYPELLPQLLNKLRIGGLLVSDNVLWQGKIVNTQKDGPTQAVHEYNQMLFQSNNLWTSIVPLRDGLALTLKLKK